MKEPGPESWAGLRSTTRGGEAEQRIVAGSHSRCQRAPEKCMTTLPGLQIRDAVTPTVLKRRLSRVRNEAEGCRRCELWEHATQTVFGEGPVPARLMLVGEQPGDHEDLEGHPFV